MSKVGDVMTATGFDMENRDPNNLNEHLQVENSQSFMEVMDVMKVWSRRHGGHVRI